MEAIRKIPGAIVISLPDASEDDLATLLANLSATAREHTRCAASCEDWADGGRCTRRARALACIDAILEEQNTRRLIALELPA